MEFTNNSSTEGMSNLVWNIIYLLMAALAVIMIVRFVTKRSRQAEIKLLPFMRPFLFIALVISVSWYFFGSVGSWKKKQFKSCEEMLAAFKGIDYDEIEEKFGKPFNTFEHYNGFGCAGDEASYEATWSGVGVRGKDTRIQFNAIVLTGTSHLTPIRSCSIICD